jgi:hypothetical protein
MEARWRPTTDAGEIMFTPFAIRPALPALVFALALFSGAVRAEGVKVTVVAILATEDNTKVDPRLSCIAKLVQTKLDSKLTGFRLASMSYKTVKVGASERFDLVGDQSVTVTVERGADKDNRIQVKVTPPLMGDVTYDTVCGKYLPVITRYRTEKSNELLLFAIRVQPCSK